MDDCLHGNEYGGPCAKCNSERRARDRESSAALLRERGIPFVSKNNGAHLIVGRGGLFDFWPSTGKWIDRRTKEADRGVFRLLRRIAREVAP